ncbi:TetR family transcriptional regulator [Streptomyces sp. NPDC053048]|uniref:TetR family transcriptional regulator n=1 Tax=Streptomyces sp. NPDC053048 TaxID=3365694 RepID=UPI0037D828D1
MAKQERALRTREGVLDAAAEEFSAHGYAHTTMQAVAARTGMTKGALYGHFPTKDDLADELVRHGEAVWDELNGQADAAGTGPVTVLRALVLGLAGSMSSDTRVRAAFRLSRDRTAAGHPGGELLGSVHRNFASRILSAQGAGEVGRHHPPESAARLLLAIVMAQQSVPLAIGDQIHSTWPEFAWSMAAAALTEH